MWDDIKFYFSKMIIKIFGNVQFFPYPMFFLFWGDTHYRVTGDEATEVLKKIKKGDILLVRYDRYVSSWFIPGFYTHVVFYIGDNMVIHAVTKGVSEQDILTVLRCDYICVLRPRLITGLEIDEAVSRAKTFIGEEYDFLFSNDTDDHLYCSELVKKAYGTYFGDLGIHGVISPDEYRSQKHLETIHESREWRERIGNKE